MKGMVLLKATKDSEAGTMPSTALLEAMGKFNQGRCVGWRRSPAIVSRQASGV